MAGFKALNKELGVLSGKDPKVVKGFVTTTNHRSSMSLSNLFIQLKTVTNNLTTKDLIHGA
jgi:hypothetical protein